MPWKECSVMDERLRFVTTASCMDTSTCWPRPVAWRCCSAAKMPIAMCMPVPESPIAGLDVGRRIFGEAGDAHRPAHGLGDRLEALESAVGPVGAETLDGGVNESRVDLGQRCVAEPEAIERARPEILHQHVRLGDHLSEQILAGVGL